MRWILVVVMLVAGCSATTSTPPAPGWWRPQPGLRWQYQLVPTTRTGPGIVNGINVQPCDPPVCPTVYGIDLWVDSQITGGATDVVNRQAVDAIHAHSARAICYFSGGTLEAWRPDAHKILDWDAAHPDAHLVSKQLAPPYDNERWFDIKPGAGRLEFLAEVMSARMKLCADNGFDAVDPDWPDAWLHNDEAGWSEPITAADQLAYNRMLAKIAHGLGLAIVLKNDSKQAPELVGDFDLAVIEDCEWAGADIQPCDPLAAFTDVGKPVLHVEYLESDQDPPERNPLGTPAAICAAAKPATARFDTIVKQASKNLADLPWTPCK